MMFAPTFDFVLIFLSCTAFAIWCMGMVAGITSLAALQEKTYSAASLAGRIAMTATLGCCLLGAYGVFRSGRPAIHALPVAWIPFVPGLLGLIGIRLTQSLRGIAGTCSGCGYDLRASKDSVNCPECGDPIDQHPLKQ